MARKNGKIPLGITVGLIATAMRLLNEYKIIKVSAAGNTRLQMAHMVKVTTGYVSPELSAAGGGDAGFSQFGEAFATWAPTAIGYGVSTYVGGSRNGQGLNLNRKINLPLFKL